MRLHGSVESDGRSGGSPAWPVDSRWMDGMMEVWTSSCREMEYFKSCWRNDSIMVLLTIGRREAMVLSQHACFYGSSGLMLEFVRDFGALVFSNEASCVY